MAVIAIAVFPFIAGAATLSITPSSGSYTVDDTFTATIYLDTNGIGVDGVDFRYLRYDPALLELVDIDMTQSGTQITAGSLMSNTVQNIADTQAGIIDFSQLTAGGSKFTSSGAEVLATAKFIVKNAGTASLFFNFTPGVSDDTNVVSNVVDVLTSATGATYSLSAKSQSGGSSNGGGSGGGGGGSGGFTPVLPPANFIAYGGPDQVVLTWKNPTDVSFVRVRVIRNENAPPSSIDDGTIIYEGTDEEFTDTNLIPGTAYYYAIYSLDYALRTSDIRHSGTGATRLGDLSEDQIIKKITEEKTKNVIVAAPSGNTFQFSYRFTLPLQLDSVGEEVKQLQIFLNKIGFTITSTGPGSPGNETSYFGVLTRDAVARFQERYLSGIPSGDRGLVGPSTRAKLNELVEDQILVPLPPVISAEGYSFTRDLTIGSRGEDVLQLQKFLNTNGFTVSVTGPGAPGSETDYFGSLTNAAVARFQEAYTTQILLPVGLSKGTGYFGPSTRKQIHALVGSGGVPQPQQSSNSLQQQIDQLRAQAEALLKQLGTIE